MKETFVNRVKVIDSQEIRQIYGDFHDIHNITAEGKIIKFINPIKKEKNEFLSLYVCPVCLDKLTVGEFVERCMGFKNIIYDTIVEILNAELGL